METANSARRPGRPPGQQGADLLDTARQVFLERGFNGTTMSEVATRAGISKTSLYREHDSKDALFAAVVTDWATRGRDAMRPLVRRVLDAEDLSAALVELAGVIQAAVLSPNVVQMRRLVASEAARSPEVADAYLADTWDSNIATLAEAFAELDRRGAVTIIDAPTAAQQFTWTAVGAALNARTIGGDHAATPTEQLDRMAIAAAHSVLSPTSVAPPG